MADDAVVIVNGARTAMGSLMGTLAPVQAPRLGAISISEAIRRSGLEPADIQEVIMGCVLPAGLGQGPARQAMLQADIPASSGATTINKLCGSGMKATMFAHDLIKAGTNDLMVTGGMESMSNAPYLLDRARAGYRMGHGRVMDHMFLDGLEDAETGKLMGAFAQEMADDKGITREDMDEFAITSLKRAQQAIDQGWFGDEIVPVTHATRKGEVTVDTDEQPAETRLDKVPQLKPAFAKDGTVTAANASSISDGSSALVLARESVVRERGLAPQARVLGHATNSRHPSEFTIAPIGATENLMQKMGWTVEDVDLFEINEAFAMVAMMPMQELGIPHDKLNIHGGGCALGHPIGSTGSRLIVTLMHALRRTGGTRGIASLCIGGGEATAVAIELL
jgi:acetyl-CoA C-acetyltransferase